MKLTLLHIIAQLLIASAIFGTSLASPDGVEAFPDRESMFALDMDGEVLYNGDHLKVSYLYPNPASNFVAFDYFFVHEGHEAHISVRNVLGSEVSNLKLLDSSNQVSIPLDGLDNGIYFYTLYVDGQAVVSKKFMVK